MSSPSLGAAAEGLSRAQALPLGRDSQAARLDLALSAQPGALSARIEALHRLVKGDLELGAFGSAWAELRRRDLTWSPDYGVSAGLRLSW